MNDKKFRKSPIAIACYVIAALLMVYTLFTLKSTVAYIVGYLGSYGMTIMDNFGDSVSYILTAVVQPLVLTIVVFMAGYILEEVRSLNPDYYYTDAEWAAKKEAKAAAKAAKAAAKEAAKTAKKAVEETATEAAVEAEEVVEEAIEEATEEN